VAAALGRGARPARHPFICCFSDGDPITRGLDRELRERVPGARGQPRITPRGGHYLREDDAATFARLVVRACGR
jgi:haloalkane dehalogenase